MYQRNLKTLFVSSNILRVDLDQLSPDDTEFKIKFQSGTLALQPMKKNLASPSFTGVNKSDVNSSFHSSDTKTNGNWSLQ